MLCTDVILRCKQHADKLHECTCNDSGAVFSLVTCPPLCMLDVQAELLLEHKLAQLRAEVTAHWKQKMEASVAESLSSATRYHSDQLECQQQRLADSLTQQHAEELHELQTR